MFRSFLSVRLRCDLRASALRCCQCWMMLAVCSMSVGEARPLSHQLSTSAPTAAWTWQTVTSGFFPPHPLSATSQEQVTDAR